MTVRRIFFAHELIEVANTGYKPTGTYLCGRGVVRDAFGYRLCYNTNQVSASDRAHRAPAPTWEDVSRISLLSGTRVAWSYPAWRRLPKRGGPELLHDPHGLPRLLKRGEIRSVGHDGEPPAGHLVDGCARLLRREPGVVSPGHKQGWHSDGGQKFGEILSPQ